jgi:hypothetical protein
MAWVDERGRLFGKVSLLDVGAAVVLLVAIVAVLLVPGRQAGSVVQVGQGSAQTIEVDMIVRGISSRSLDSFEAGSQADLIIRNQPYGQVEVYEIEDVTRTVPLMLPDGTVEQFPDPEAYRRDLVLRLRGQGRTTESGVVLGNNRVKIGVPLELETFDYNLRGTVMEVRVVTTTTG